MKCPFILLVMLVAGCVTQPLVHITPEDSAYASARAAMVDTQLKSRDITDPGVLYAMGRVQRHLFVTSDYLGQAYADHPLPIGYGQTISQPYVVAFMTQSLGLSGNERVLEIGTGSGYQAAVLAELVPEVYTIEIVPELASSASQRLSSLNYTNVFVLNADGYFGWEEHAPFDAIMITAAVDHIPSPLLNQLNDGGTLILPLGSPLYYQTLTLVEKHGSNYTTRYLLDVNFVPMTGKAQE